MPNGPTHQLLGALSGAAVAHRYVTPALSPLDRQAGTPLLVIGGLIIGSLGGRIPDVLDPPIHPNHRAFFHSIALGCVVTGTVAVTLKKLREARRDRPNGGASPTHGDLDGTRGSRPASIGLNDALLFALVLALLAGVLSHLWADSGTPKGLPLIG